MLKHVYQTKLLYPKLLWKRPVHFYKAEAGKVLVLAGSKGMTGAAILTCEAVFRSGTGILMLGFPESLKFIYKDILPEAMTLSLPETLSISLSKKSEQIILDQAETCDVIIIGPGLSQNPETIQLIWQLLFRIEKPIVLDADGLFALAKGIEVVRRKEDTDFLIKYFNKIPGRLILTPHPGEALKLFHAIRPTELKDEKVTTDFIERNKEKTGEILTKYLNCLIVLKGHDTIICDHDNLVVNKTGGAELSTAGSGDVLSGIVGSFIGQNPKKIFEATCTAVYLHGLAGELGKSKVGERSLTASDIIRYLPEAIIKAESDL